MFVIEVGLNLLMFVWKDVAAKQKKVAEPGKVTAESEKELLPTIFKKVKPNFMAVY